MLGVRVVFAIALLATTTPVRADIFRIDNGAIIPGTGGVTPGPGLTMNFWNSASRNLRFASLGGIDLANASFDSSWLGDADFADSNLVLANFANADLTRVNFTNADLTDANLTKSILTNTQFSGATVAGARLSDVTSRGFTKEQLYATASYRQQNLQGIWLAANDLTGVNFSGQNLTNAVLFLSELTNADFAGAVIYGGDFQSTTSRGFTKEQLYSTASYQQHNLQQLFFYQDDLSDWDFREQNLFGAVLDTCTLVNANFTGANVSGSYLGDTTSLGFTKEQLYSTASYRQRNLYATEFDGNDLSGWDLHGQNLTYGSFQYATLGNTNFTDADVTNARFDAVVGFGFTKEQLYSTESYQRRDLTGIVLTSNDLSGWDFHGQILRGAEISGGKLDNANLAGANLTNANFVGTTWIGANLMATDFTGAAIFQARFDSADARGAKGIDFTGSQIRRENTIMPDWTLMRIRLVTSGEQLVIRDFQGPNEPHLSSITATWGIEVAQGGVLRIIFGQDAWDSTIAFGPGASAALGGTLDLSFATDVDLTMQYGRTLKVFDWSNARPTGTFHVNSELAWNLSRLYTTGEVTLRMPGDADSDGITNRVDLAILVHNYGLSIGAEWSKGDFDHDGRVGIADLVILKRHLTISGFAVRTNAIPEPASIVLLLPAAVLFLAIRICPASVETGVGGLKSQTQSRPVRRLGNWSCRKHCWEFPWDEELQASPLGTESQQCPVILRCTNAIA